MKMGALGGTVKTIFLLLLCWATSVELQDAIESSGAGEVTELLVPELFETPASGGGSDTTSDSGINVGILSDLAEQELNGTYIPIVPNNGNLNTMYDELGMDSSDTTAKTVEAAVPSTTQEIATTSTTMRETTVSIDETDEPGTTTTSTPLEMTTSKPTTTNAPTTTTTVVVTTSRRTTIRTTKRLSTQKPLIPMLSTTTSTTTSDYERPFCNFNEEDFQCSVEITCFGDGEVDCTETDEKELQNTSTTPHTTGDDYEDEYEESSMSPTELSQLVGRILPWKKLPPIRYPRPSSATADMKYLRQILYGSTKPSFETSSGSTTIQELSTTDSTIHTRDTTTSVSSVPTTTTEEPPLETASTSIPLFPVELSAMPIEKFSTETVSSGVQTPNYEKSISKGSPDSETTWELPSTVSLEMNTEKRIDSSSSDNVDSVGVHESKSRKRRSKRQNKDPVPESSVLSPSESLKLSNFVKSKDGKEARLCRIKGNVICSPLPTVGICKGKGLCEGPSEKKEKSTGGKGVENWAIAVIVICATAAAVTIGLLVYLVITSWKKLKVQPQNGVTTLTYVNNTTP